MSDEDFFLLLASEQGIIVGKGMNGPLFYKEEEDFR